MRSDTEELNFYMCANKGSVQKVPVNFSMNFCLLFAWATLWDLSTYLVFVQCTLKGASTSEQTFQKLSHMHWTNIQTWMPILYFDVYHHQPAYFECIYNESSVKTARICNLLNLRLSLMSIKLSHDNLVLFLKASHMPSFLDSVVITQISCAGSFAKSVQH